MNNLIPNLPELAKSLENDSDAAELVAAFLTDSIEQAQANLRRIALDWEAEERVAGAGEVAP